MKIKRINYSRLALAVLILLTTCGCSSVISRRPVGEGPARIVAKDWEGNWLGPDGPVNVKVVDADKSILRAAWLEDDEQGKSIMKTAEVELRQSGDWIFANTLEDKGRGYIWGRIKNEDGRIIVWGSDEKLFKPLMEEGVLPGTIDGDEVILNDLEPRHLKIITSAERGILFSWDEPLVFVKIGN